MYQSPWRADERLPNEEDQEETVVRLPPVVCRDLAGDRVYDAADEEFMQAVGDVAPRGWYANVYHGLLHRMPVSEYDIARRAAHFAAGDWVDRYLAGMNRRTPDTLIVEREE